MWENILRELNKDDEYVFAQATRVVAEIQKSSNQQKKSKLFSLIYLGQDNLAKSVDSFNFKTETKKIQNSIQSLKEWFSKNSSSISRTKDWRNYTPSYHKDSGYTKSKNFTYNFSFSSFSSSK